MKWDGGEESENVQDRRGGGDDEGASGGGGGGSGLTGTHMGLGTGGLIVVLIVGYFLGVDPSQLAQIAGSNGGSSSGTPSQVQRPVNPGNAGKKVAPPNDRAGHFIKVVLGYTEKVWDEQFKKMGKVYEKPKLVIFSGQTRTGCGMGTTAMGPFYCPADKTVYIDPNFYDELARDLGGSKADFSNAYVIAHEIGHHVQNLLGYSDIVDQKRQELSKTEFNKWSVRLELQADYLAGVWAHYADQKYHMIEAGDAEEAIKSASAIGDDTLQKRGGGRVSPQSYTHGTSAQRVKWYSKGLKSGDFSQLEAIFKIPYESL
ncbi:MAG: neutral zinc metallopeptidase [Planctomycetota bacterium]